MTIQELGHADELKLAVAQGDSACLLDLILVEGTNLVTVGSAARAIHHAAWPCRCSTHPTVWITSTSGSSVLAVAWAPTDVGHEARTVAVNARINLDIVTETLESYSSVAPVGLTSSARVYPTSARNISSQLCSDQ